MAGWKPEGYPSLSAYLVAPDARRLIEFAVRAFDARELRRYDLPDGRIMHAELRVHDSVLMVGDGSPEWPPFPVFLHLYVPDVDAAYGRALEAGGIPVQAPEQKEGDPDRRGGVRDPAGNTWWVSSQVVSPGTGATAAE